MRTTIFTLIFILSSTISIYADLSPSKYEILAKKYEDLETQLHRERASVCINLRVRDIDVRTHFPTITTIQEEGTYVDFEKLDLLFKKSLSDKPQDIGRLFDVMHSLRVIETRIMKEYTKLTSMYDLNIKYIRCLARKKEIINSVDKKVNAGKQSKIYIKLINTVHKNRNEISQILNKYSEHVNLLIERSIETTK